MKLPVTPQILSIWENVHNNSDLLPQTFPRVDIDTKSRFMEDIHLIDYHLAILSQEITPDQLHDINCLNHWLISKYGRNLR